METFFMRFYGRTNKEIVECLDKMGLGDIAHSIEDAKVSCNAIIPDPYHPVSDMVFHPITERQMLRIKSDEVRAIYLKWSTPNTLPAEVVERKAKESAFGV